MNQESRHIYRITYTKGENVKYISHLDFLRCVNRSFKRGKIPVKYSNGFNPHVLLNIALPCPVGVSSVCEMLDIELFEEMEPRVIKERLTNALPTGFEVISAVKKETEPDFYDISSALYEIDFKSDVEIDIEKFISEPEFMIEKKSKRGMKEVNIKDFIRKMDFSDCGNNTYKLNAAIDAGSKSNLKTELLLNAMQNYFGAKFCNVKTMRKEIYF